MADNNGSNEPNRACIISLVLIAIIDRTKRPLEIWSMKWLVAMNIVYIVYSFFNISGLAIKHTIRGWFRCTPTLLVIDILFFLLSIVGLVITVMFFLYGEGSPLSNQIIPDSYPEIRHFFRHEAFGLKTAKILMSMEVFRSALAFHHMASTWMALERRAITDQELLDAKMNILPAPPIAVPNSFNVAATQPRHSRRSGTHADEVPEPVEEDQSSSVYSNAGGEREQSGPVGDSGIATTQESLEDLQDAAGMYLSSTELQEMDVEGDMVE